MTYAKPVMVRVASAIEAVQSVQHLKAFFATDTSGTGDMRPSNSAYEADE